MIKLLDLLLEVDGQKKAIIMAGGAGVGKSTFVKKIRPDLKKAGWIELNPDKYTEDPESVSKSGTAMFNKPSVASREIDTIDLPNAITARKNFLYDTTASNIKRIENDIKNKGYDIMMVMVYTNPVVSFLRNFKRERKVPTVGVLSSWNNSYKNISTYKSMFGDNFYIVQTDLSPDEEKMVTEFKEAHKSGKLKEFFGDLLSSGEFKSTFRKDPTKQKSPEELAKSKELVDKQIDVLSKQFDTIEDQVNKIKIEDMDRVANQAKSFIKK